MIKKSIFGIALIFYTGMVMGQTQLSPAWTIHSDPFQSNVFVQNMGQFDNWAKAPSTIKYGSINGSGVFFLQRGITFKVEEVLNTPEEEREAIEHGEKTAEKAKAFYINMKWEGSNPDVILEASNQSEGYFTFGEKGYENVKAKGYRKLIYKNLYDHIDVEYVIPEKGGIKYSLIAHPGADLSLVKMHYSGDVNSINKDAEGNLIIETPKGNITDHAPLSFYNDNGASIESSFDVNQNIVSFRLKVTNKNLQSITIDPWTTTPAGLTTDNAAYDAGYDYYGNVYVSGGSAYPHKLSKYSPTGTFLWTFTNPTGWDASGGATVYYSKFCVLPNSGSVLIGEGFNPSGSRIMKIGNTGTLLKTTPNLAGNNEIWLMFYNACSGQLIGFGGGTQNPKNIQTIADTNLSSSIASCFNSYSSSNNDIACAKMDNNGDFYAFLASSVSSNNIQKSLKSSNYAPPVAFDVSSGYSFTEAGENNIIANQATNRANILALNSMYLFSYDGQTIKAWDKTTGALLGSDTVPGSAGNGDNRYAEGIAVDECNNVYVGGNQKVYVYKYNTNNTFTAGTDITSGITGYVYDLVLDHSRNTLIAAGNGFVTTTAVFLCDQFAVSDSTSGTCSGGSSCIKVKGGTPPYSYQWSTGETTQCLSNLSAGTYYVTITDNSCNRHVQCDSIKIGNGSLTVNVSSATICKGKSITLTASGANSYTWSPGTGLNNTIGASVAASPALTTTYTVVGSSGAGCTASATVIVTVLDTTVTADAGLDVYYCPEWGESVTLTVNGGSTFLWSTGQSTQSILVSPVATTTYIVTVQNTCSSKPATDTVKVTVRCGVRIPNVITPNGDSNNQYFYISGLEAYPSSRLEIFDRWGLKMYESSNYLNDWDGGNYKTGMAVPDGVYFYILYLSNNNAEPFRGFVQVIR